MKNFVVAGLGLAPLVLYIVALATDYWIVSSGTGTFGSYSLHYGPFHSAIETGGSKFEFAGCGSASNTLCNRIMTSRAFVIMALIIVAGAIALAGLNKGQLSGAVYAISGIFGMIGWAVWYGGVQKASDTTSVLTSLGTTSELEIGYSQALVLASWTLSLVLSPLAFVLMREA